MSLLHLSGFVDGKQIGEYRIRSYEKELTIGSGTASLLVFDCPDLAERQLELKTDRTLAYIRNITAEPAMTIDGQVTTGWIEVPHEATIRIGNLELHVHYEGREKSPSPPEQLNVAPPTDTEYPIKKTSFSHQTVLFRGDAGRHRGQILALVRNELDSYLLVNSRQARRDFSDDLTDLLFNAPKSIRDEDSLFLLTESQIRAEFSLGEDSDYFGEVFSQLETRDCAMFVFVPKSFPFEPPLLVETLPDSDAANETEEELRKHQYFVSLKRSALKGQLKTKLKYEEVASKANMPLFSSAAEMRLPKGFQIGRIAELSDEQGKQIVVERSSKLVTRALEHSIRRYTGWLTRPSRVASLVDAVEETEFSLNPLKGVYFESDESFSLYLNGACQELISNLESIV